MKKILLISSPFFFYLIYGLYLSNYLPTIFRTQLEPQNSANYYDYRGITHSHSNRSTGSGSIEEMVAAAKDASMDFLIITDLNIFDDQPAPDGYDGNLLVFSGGEYSYLDSRLLYYDAPPTHQMSGIGQAQVYFSDMLSQQRKKSDPGIVVLAHPFKSRYQWAGDYPPGLDGIEVINLLSLWERAWTESKVSTIWSVLVYPFNQQLALFRLYEEPKQELELWDKLNASRPTIGFAGTDASAKATTFTDQYLKIPSYQRSFEIVSNHVLLNAELTGNTESDKKKILTALKKGQFYMSLDLLGNPKGFFAEVRAENETYPMGSSVKLSKGMTMVVRLAQKPETPFEVVIVKDGKRFLTSNSQQTVMNLYVPGVYRVVVRLIPTLPLPDGKKWFPWIYSNAFYIK